MLTLSDIQPHWLRLCKESGTILALPILSRDFELNFQTVRLS